MPDNRKSIFCDYLVIGSGIIGLALAREINANRPDARIVVVEKEPGVAYHSSGRNSGILHAGFYYTADTLKARFTKEGNALMRQYCYDNHLRINECKKVVVAMNENELQSLFELEKRGKTNGVDVELIDEKALKEIEPNAVTYKYALYSPNTASVDPEEICRCLEKELQAKGIVFYFKEPYLKRLSANTIQTANLQIEAGKIINAAGLYADKIAKDYGFSSDYTIVPFKGIYLKYTKPDKPVHTNIYPVPNLKNPFLGVHYTVTVDGSIKIGPTSIPSFWRENYKGLANFKMGEMNKILYWEAKLFLLNSFGFRSLAVDEIKKYNRNYFSRLATRMVRNINAKGFSEWSKPGIRAQLLNIKTNELVMDFVVEGDKNSTHILNAVSPAFTGCMPFAKWVVEKYI